jgi:hypothetical protein
MTKKTTARETIVLAFLALVLVAVPAVAVVANCYDGTGNMSIESTPAGAAVYIDCEPPATDGVTPECHCEPAGYTPALITDLEPGEHCVLLRAEGYADLRETVEVVEGETATYRFDMTPVQLGSLNIESTPAGAAVWIERQECPDGQVPDSVTAECHGEPAGYTPLLITDLEAGMYKVVLKAEGYEKFRETVEVVAGETTTYSFAMIPLGNLSIESTPAGAAVWLERQECADGQAPDSVTAECHGEPAGYTPVLITDLRAGMYTVVLKAEGYEKFRESVEVVAGETTPYTFTMTPLPPGSINLNSMPKGASVFLDGNPAGATPVLLPDLSQGKHRIVLKAEGYYDLTRKVNVQSGKTKLVNAKLRPIPSGFGNLSVNSTPQGASIFLDGEYVGITPALLEHLTQGKHLMTLNLTGYRDTTRKVMVISDLTIRKMFVMHKIKPGDKQ